MLKCSSQGERFGCREAHRKVSALRPPWGLVEGPVPTEQVPMPLRTVARGFRRETEPSRRKSRMGSSKDMPTPATRRVHRKMHPTRALERRFRRKTDPASEGAQ